MSPTATNQPAPIKAVRSLSSDANLLKARRKNRWSLFFGFGTDHKTDQSLNSTRSLPIELEQPMSQPLSAPKLVSEFSPDLSDTSLFDFVFQQTEGTNVQEPEDQPIDKVSRPAPTASNPHTFIPAYFYPGEIWNRSLQQPSNVEYMVMNPNSGPGDAPNPHYIQQIKEAQSAGIKILGYVHTSYGKRSPTLVRKEISLFMEWYKVDGIFLDEVPSSRLDLPYFQSLAVYIRSLPGPLIVINPGVYPDEGYMQVL
ncbi:Spherulation-specific family 4-domain-containing protein [Obelidium mucronatum]|nr:Spherulation-specific family 4-domain-containing protein [Obelidium mucronatum]